MGGVKHDLGKPQLDLLPSMALLAIGEVLGDGGKIYGRENWRGGIAQSRLIAAAMRHLLKWKDVSHIDPDSGYSHLAHAACGILFALEQECRGQTHLDDSWVAVRDLGAAEPRPGDGQLLEVDDDHTDSLKITL